MEFASKNFSFKALQKITCMLPLLRRLFALPCQSSLKNLLNKLPLKPGINAHVFESIKKFSKQYTPQGNIYSLLFDEMSIRKNLTYNAKYDQVDGLQDHGLNHGRDPEVASHALVFMINGIRKKTKQPVAYYLSGDHVKSDRLSVIIKEVSINSISIYMIFEYILFNKYYKVYIQISTCQLTCFSLSLGRKLGMGRYKFFYTVINPCPTQQFI